MLKERFKKYFITLIMLIMIGCILLFFYMTVFRWIDYEICIPAMAEKVGVPPTMYGLETYVQETATPDMKRDEVMKILEKLGPVDVRFQTPNPEGFRDTIFIRSCKHPLNNLQIYAFYSSEGRLLSISLLNTLE